jgi:ferredoxin
MTVRITVDRAKCQGYGQCEFVAADLFHLDASGTAVPEADVDESHRADAELAVERCPMQAISIE